MGDKSAIDWLYDPFLDRQGASWNLFWGCQRWSPACLNCYIFRQPPLRMRNLQFDKAGIGGKTEIVYADRRVLFFPLRKQKPLMIFVESLGDLWEGRINIRRTAEVYAVALLAPRHIFITSTKRTRRMHNWLTSPRFRVLVAEAMQAILAEKGNIADADYRHAANHLAKTGPGGALVPPPNMWVGTTVENNRVAADRIPLLRATPAAVRWISCEPLTDELTDPLDLEPWLRPMDGRYGDPLPPVDWAVFGGESGPAAKATPLDTAPAVGLRPIDLANLERQVGVVQRHGGRPFVKQLGEPWARDAGAASRKGSDPDEWPAALRVRRYPLQLAQRALAINPGNTANPAARNDLHDRLAAAR